MWKCGYKYLRCEKLLKICQIVPTLQIREHLVNILFCSAVSCSFMNASIHFLWTPNYAMTEYRVILLTANFSICATPLGLEFCNLQPMPKVPFKQGFHLKPSPQAIYIDLLLRSRSKCRRRHKQMSVIFYIRMKTANDFIKHLED